MTIDPSLDEALNSPIPLQRLRELMQRFLAQGMDRHALLDLLERNRKPLRDAGREADEDLLLEVMDFLAGWCNPTNKL